MGMIQAYYAALLGGFSTASVSSFFDWFGGTVTNAQGKVTALLDTQGRRQANYNGSATNNTSMEGGVLQLRGTGASGDTSTSFALQMPSLRSGIIFLNSFNVDLINMLLGARLLTGISAGSIVDVFIRGSEISLDGNAGGGAAYNLRINGSPVTVTPGSNGNYLGSFSGPIMLQFNYTMSDAAQLEYLFRRWASGFAPNADVARLTLSQTLWSEADIQKLEGLYTHDLGRTDKLPASHPYKNTRP